MREVEAALVRLAAHSDEEFAVVEKMNKREMHEEEQTNVDSEVMI